jgi:hypothetical protein
MAEFAVCAGSSMSYYLKIVFTANLALFFALDQTGRFHNSCSGQGLTRLTPWPVTRKG